MSRNKREGRYAGYYFGVHRRTREMHKSHFGCVGPEWLWVSRKVHAQLGKRFKSNMEVRKSLRERKQAK